MPAGLHSFWRFRERIHCLAFPSFKKPPDSSVHTPCLHLQSHRVASSDLFLTSAPIVTSLSDTDLSFHLPLRRALVMTRGLLRSSRIWAPSRGPSSHPQADSQGLAIRAWTSSRVVLLPATEHTKLSHVQASLSLSTFAQRGHLCLICRGTIHRPVDCLPETPLSSLPPPGQELLMLQGPV